MTSNNIRNYSDIIVTVILVLIIVRGRKTNIRTTNNNDNEKIIPMNNSNFNDNSMY